ncbi:MAG: hypothetical protein K6V97_03795 [Actinomycetia bacterium]|nr:hypothetical protein [Actinomycetes bacterium]
MFDEWDWSRWLLAGGAAISFVAARTQNAKTRAQLEQAGYILAGVRLALEALTPPRCPSCRVRAIRQNGQWCCPHGHGLVPWQA